MNDLIKYGLEFSRTLTYVRNCLNNSNKLSEMLLVDFDFGSCEFFALFPSNITHEQLHEFYSGGILPRGNFTEMQIDGHLFKSEMINTVSDEVAEWIYKNLRSNHSMSCIFDAVNRSVAQEGEYDLFIGNGLSFEDELYYHVNHKSSIEVISRCLCDCTASIWHSLFVLAEVSFDEVLDRKLSIEKIEQICLNAKAGVVGAYDGEGFVFFEKQIYHTASSKV